MAFMPSRSDLLHHTADLATNYLSTVANRHVGATATADELRAQLGGELQDTGEPGEVIVDALARAAERGTVATQGPRYFVRIGDGFPQRSSAEFHRG
jgi:hypothetical protein